MARLFAGCSFTDPLWQSAIPWSSQIAKEFNSHTYIIAKAGMGWYGICSEVYRYMDSGLDVDQVVLMLPDLWRLDVEVAIDSGISNTVVDLIRYSDEMEVIKSNRRYWIISGGMHFSQCGITGRIFNDLYKYQGNEVIIQNSMQMLVFLVNYLHQQGISCKITSITDPMHCIEYFDNNDIMLDLLDKVGYNDWVRFDGYFVDDFLGHSKHPTTQEHSIIKNYILNIIGE